MLDRGGFKFQIDQRKKEEEEEKIFADAKKKIREYYVWENEKNKTKVCKIQSKVKEAILLVVKIRPKGKCSSSIRKFHQSAQVQLDGEEVMAEVD